jgi:hypothetical protein
MQSDNRELWAAFTAIIFITLFYFLATILLGGTPRSSGLVGHGIGILGFILMVMTEVLYSWRKRSRRAHWGRMSQWLNFHIFTGIVGPYMVLLHTAWNFSGLAGVAMLLTMVIVISGFIGRYIYTAVPRTADGIEVEAGQLQNQMDVLQSEFENWARANPQAAAALEAVMPAQAVSADGGTALIFNRTFEGWRQNRQWRASVRRLDPKLRAQADQYERLVRRQQILRRQVASLAMARRTLALWHAIHVPIGMALFTAAIIHIVAAFYFATLLR